ncbi:MAG: Hpt domain-containing protein [Spirochaetes bacterium]|nr:Hpt domain-containing protein [Spirochaetota bacterium]
MNKLDVPIHIDELLERINGDTEKLVDLLKISLNEFPKWERTFNSALTDKNFKSMERLAHTYKGSCATMGMPDASFLFCEIEKLSRSENLSEVSKTFNKAWSKITSASVIIKDYIEQFQKHA